MKLTQLGNRTEIPANPNVTHLETIENKHKASLYCVRFTCVEWTSMCPVTGAPDFAHIILDYIPHHSLIESKSLKIFFHSFRNHRAFHEDCIALVANRLYGKLDPHWLRVAGFFAPRGGVPLDVFFTLGQIPDHGIHIPGVDRQYRGW